MKNVLKGVGMRKLRLIFNIRNFYMFFLIYFFYGYFKPTTLQQKDIYKYISQYFGIYEKILWVFFCMYIFSLYMKNRRKQLVLKVRLYFFLILSILTGYLYLLEDMRKMNFPKLSEVQNLIMKAGLLRINLGYFEVDSFIELYKRVDPKILYGVLIFLIFISVVMLIGKIVRCIIGGIINGFKRKLEKRRMIKRLEKERKEKEKQEKLEREIYEEIENMRKKYGEKAENVNEEINIEENTEEEEEKNDISI